MGPSSGTRLRATARQPCDGHIHGEATACDTNISNTIAFIMSTKLLHIAGDSKFGGGSVVVQQLALLAKTMGWQVDCLTTDPVFQDVLRCSGIGVVPLDVIRRPIGPINDLRGLGRLSSFLKSHRYDLVHTHSSKAGFIGRRAAWGAGVPGVIHTVHGFAFHEESSPLSLWAYSSLERMAARWCHRIVTVSNYHREWASRLRIGNHSQLVAIPNGISEERVVANRPREVVRRSWSVSDDELVLLSTGRLAQQKGLEYLIEAVPILAARLARRFRVVIAGEGPLKDSLNARAHRLGVQDRVLFLGFQWHVGDLLGAADLVVLPSLWEGLSIALLEAMAAGKPIVTTDIGSNCEATRHGDGALLVPTKSPSALAEALIQLVEDPLKAEALGREGRGLYIKHYTLDTMLAHYHLLYSSFA